MTTTDPVGERPAADPGPRHAGAPSRMRLVAAGLGAALVAFALAGASYAGRPMLTGAVFVVQVLTVLAWLAVLDARGAIGGAVIAGGAALVADLLLAEQSGAGIARLAPVVGVAVVLSMLHQTARRPRVEVTGSVAATVSAVVLVAGTAAFVGLRGGPGGREAVTATLLGAGAALLVARLVDLGLPRPAVVRDGSRGVVGLLAGLAVAAGLGAWWGDATASVGTGDGLLLAVIAGALALVGDLAVDAARVGLGDAHARQREAVTPAAVLLPFALCGPAAYVAGRILLG